MNPPSSEFSDSRNLLVGTIKGYSGYEELEKRGQSDRDVREHLEKNLEHLQERLGHPPKASDHQIQERVNLIYQKTRRKIDTICQSLKSPTYEDSTFFSTAKVNKRVINQLYNLESSLLSKMQTLADELDSHVGRSLKADEVNEHFTYFQDFIDNFSQDLFEREALILALEEY
jgi:hypothetical protein